MYWYRCCNSRNNSTKLPTANCSSTSVKKFVNLLLCVTHFPSVKNLCARASLNVCFHMCDFLHVCVCSCAFMYVFAYTSVLHVFACMYAITRKHLHMCVCTCASAHVRLEVCVSGSITFDRLQL